MTNISRRKLLGSSAKSVSALAVLSAFPPAIQRALAIPANCSTGSINDVEHVVILMQENRSFDHYFGALKGVRGFGDRFPIPLPDGRKVWQQGTGVPGIYSLPFHLDSSIGNAQRAGGVPHSWGDAQQAWDNGRMASWVVAKTDRAMGYFKEAEVPFQYALANAFTICDAYHCGVHAGTVPNRIMHSTGTNGPTAAGVAAVINEWDSIGPSSVGNEWKTYPERLQEAGVSWKTYQNMPDNFGDNALACFKQYRKANEASGKPVSNDTASPAYDSSIDLTQPLYKGIANTMPDGGFLASFKDDIRTGNLPQVSWITAPYDYCEHPSGSSPIQGGWYMQEILDALTANPDVWSKTVFLVNFDENDGYFDHVPSPSAPSLNPDGTAAGKATLPKSEIAFERFTHPKPPGSTAQPTPDKRVYGPGPRVPMLVISPWSRGGWVNSQVFDHTSVLRFLEQRFSVQEPNISQYRRSVCGDLTSAFNFSNPNNEALPTMNGSSSKETVDQIRQNQEKYSLPLFALGGPLIRCMPTQDTGTRPSRALPYELHVSARSTTVAGKLQLLFSNTGSVGAVFHVYDRFHLDRIPRRYMVEAGKQLDDVWDAINDDSGRYDLWVLGPNGFHRHFRGNLRTEQNSSISSPEIRVCYDITNGNVYLNLLNSGKVLCHFHISPKAYRTDGPWHSTVAAGSLTDVHFDLAGSGQWYDFEVTCDEHPEFYRRFAGRVETGKATVSDPELGKASI